MISHPIWAEIDLNAVKNNIKEIRRITNSDSQIMAVVKANAYGHGAVEISKVVLKNGADRLAVARSKEAIELRNAGFKCPILVFGYNTIEEILELIKNDVILTVYSIEIAKDIQKIAKDIQKIAKDIQKIAKVHLKIDTGMNRLGFIPDKKTINEILKISEFLNIEIEGIYTHFADADNSDKTYTKKQFSKFMEFLTDLEDSGINIPIKHVSNSAAIIDHPETHLNMVRPGIILYGLYPSELVQKDKINLEPVMSLKCLITHVKDVPRGTKISYGCTYITKKKSKIASIPLGYADGFTRMLKNGKVLVGGKRAPIVGRICMDQCMADVSNIDDVKIGDTVLVFGKHEKYTVPVEEISNELKTINYELVCMISNRVPRVYRY
ncbi:alanine racemase [Methanococcus vannielii SB]|uniref:Alanine racemase n=1 Tax=Methanococcus vannielii (strain ATCC 35089 / DSM 1224 / JCM 13029 / OCM 148 / SB) TaxID=406327 RepID=A6UQF8_METVS|nr:alanine racemase [Methanococcus vannielii]ABR54730.1 alanine racemase [Methanococcus vannielii SB]